MNDETIVEKKRNSPPRGAGAGRKRGSFTTADKLKAVRLHIEEGFSMALVCEELGMSKSSLSLWLQSYRLGGEAGLEPKPAGERERKLPAPITDT
jgi:transposase-like protein